MAVCGTGVQMDFKGNDFYLANELGSPVLPASWEKDQTCCTAKMNHIRTFGPVQLQTRAYGTLHFSSRRCKRRICNFLFHKSVNY